MQHLEQQHEEHKKEKEEHQEKNKKDLPTYAEKWLYTLYTTAVLIAVFNPWTYKLTNSLLYSFTGPLFKNGCATWLGFVIHVVVFTLVVRGLMDIS